MKQILITLCCFICFSLTAQSHFDGHTWQAPYTLPSPANWTIERFPLPASFAPEVNYTGVEDIRFSPGWAKPNSDEYWTYAFLWYLDSAPIVNAQSLAREMKNYYTGLIKANTNTNKPLTTKPIPVSTTFKKTTTQAGDKETYIGTIKMMDYMCGKPLKLNCKVHIKNCPQSKKSFIFFQLSPQLFTNKAWIAINNLWLDFKCDS